MNIISGIAIATALVLSLAGTPAMAESAFTLQTSERAVFGSREVDEGRFSDGVQRLETALALAGTSRSLRQPVLNDLCVAYTMLRDFNAAELRCNESVANGRSTGVALNNRGVMRIAAGDYEGAVQDFAEALAVGGARIAATRNLVLAETRVAATRPDDDAQQAADNGTDEAQAPRGDERAAVLEATRDRFARAIEVDVQQLAATILDNRRG